MSNARDWTPGSAEEPSVSPLSGYTKEQGEAIQRANAEAAGSLSFSPTKERWLFMCTECGVPKLMPAIPQNSTGQEFYCAVCLEKTFFVRLWLQPPITFTLP